MLGGHREAFTYEHTDNEDGQEKTEIYEVRIMSVAIFGLSGKRAADTHPVIDQIFFDLLPYNMGKYPRTIRDWTLLGFKKRHPFLFGAIVELWPENRPPSGEDIIYQSHYIRPLVHKTLLLGTLFHKDLAQMIGLLLHWLTALVTIIPFYTTSRLRGSLGIAVHRLLPAEYSLRTLRWLHDWD